MKRLELTPTLHVKKHKTNLSLCYLYCCVSFIQADIAVLIM